MASASTPHPHCVLHACHLCAGFSLTLRRLVLVNVTLAPVLQNATLPPLWPMGMFEAPGESLAIADVRFVVADSDFQQYLGLVRSLPDSAVQYYTVGVAFLHGMLGCGATAVRHGMLGCATTAGSRISQ